ncbi:nitrate reductase [Campylobacter sp. MIT 99-7217]|uniref:nitrate reductase cytochrome c-type subunit n=1 Tax=Campylobacter sp. MIT 99-7217 TaxID=535091 RepID=UPI0011576E22|nr:nitrate reductase cytochrome c-type subunit [Campylobacter sp. MIT 99-7217]TQR33008.1 nitrate reductase [Campylobacter sp. MIT 99-7217]
MFKKMLVGLGIFAMLFIVACKDNSTKETNSSTSEEIKTEAGVSDVDIGLRRSDLAREEVVLPESSFTTLAPGEAEVIDRSFENAPPFIPHSTDGLLPITKDNNMCLSCHVKELATEVGATAMPATHYFDFRANKSTGDVISDTRFNCTLCHVPQSNAKPLVGNTFKPVFDDATLKNKSNLIDVINEGVN